MHPLNYCRVVEGIGRSPENPLYFTVGQWTELRNHVKECHKCAAIIEAVNRMFPPRPRIGPEPEAN